MVAEERKGKAELLDHGAIADHGLDTDTDDLRASLSELRILHGIALELPISSRVTSRRGRTPEQPDRR